MNGIVFGGNTMKKITKLVFGLLLTILPFKVNAFTGGISVSCTPSTLLGGEYTECLIKGTADENVTSIETTVSVGSSMSIDSFTPSSSFSGNGISSGKILVTSTGVTGSFDIGTLKLKIADNASGSISFSLTNTVYTDSNGGKNNISDSSASITVSNPVVTKGLKSLKISNVKSSSFVFSPNNYNYNPVITASTFSIEAIPVNDDDSIKIVNIENEGTALDPNSITFYPNGTTMGIKIIVGDGGTGNEYTLLISREVSSNYDNSLKTVTIGGKNISLISGQYKYDVYLDNVTNYQVTATLNDPNNFEIDKFNGGVGYYSGEHEVLLVINPKDSSTGYEGVTYQFNVKKTSSTPPSSSSKPSEPSGGNPQTGNISIFIITVILICSLIVSLNLYKKNMQNTN